MTEGEWLGEGEQGTEEMEWGSLATFLRNGRARLDDLEMGSPALAVHFNHWARRVLPDDWSPLFQFLCVHLRLRKLSELDGLVTAQASLPHSQSR